MRHYVFVYLLPLCLCSFGFFLIGADDGGVVRLEKLQGDTDRQYTTVGNIALTVSNFGTIGTRNAYWPNQPSCEYPRGSRIEHVYQGALWVGAVSRQSGQQRVSTGATDFSSASRIGQGYEFTSDLNATVVQRSSLSESPYYSGSAVSHQDFVSIYSDMNRTNPTTGDSIPFHNPLGLLVRQESYAWNYPFADFFVIQNYTIYNAGKDTLDSVYVGFWDNAVVRNTNNVRPGTPGYFDHGGNGYADTMRLMYTFDWDGIPAPPPADSYIAIKLLGCNPFPHGVDSLGDLRLHTFYNAWRFRSSSGDVDYFSPQDDAGSINGERSRYDRMAASMAQAKIDPLRTAPANVTTLVSTGPFSTLYPGDSLNVVFGVVCGRKYGSAPAKFDTRDQRKTLYSNATFCQQAYDGEDILGTNTGRHYLLPQPPPPPKLRAEVGDKSVAIYWDKSTSELAVDPVTRTHVFEGYRIYRSNPGADFTNPGLLLLSLTLVGDFDLPSDNIGYNTGFSAITLPQPKYFPGDTVAYWYRFPPPGTPATNLNGWQYVYGVAAYSMGDSALGIPSLQSKTEVVRLIPGTLPSPGKTRQIGVYPNPYYAGAVWDGTGERARKIYFYNLPQRCDIRIYTLAGDVVADIQHDAATYNGSDINWFQQFGGNGQPIQFSGGEHAWDLITKFDQAIATGLYLFSVRDANTGDIVTGKFLVIK